MAFVFHGTALVGFGGVFMYICEIYVVFGVWSVLFGGVDMRLGGGCVDKNGLFVGVSALFMRLCVG